MPTKYFEVKTDKAKYRRLFRGNFMVRTHGDNILYVRGSSIQGNQDLVVGKGQS